MTRTTRCIPRAPPAVYRSPDTLRADNTRRRAPQAWFTPLSGGHTVSHAPVQGRRLLEDNALIEIGTRRFVFHTGCGEADDCNPPSQPASPFGKRGGGDGDAPLGRDRPLPLAELPILQPHPTPGGTAATGRGVPQQTMQRSKSSPAKARLDKDRDRDKHAAPRDASVKPLRDAPADSPQFSRLRLEAEADAQRIRAEAQARASQILALAEADAQRIRDEAEAKAKAARHSVARAFWPHAAESQRAALAKAERCMAFMDKMVCLNFLSITRDVSACSPEPELDQQISLQDARALLQRAGFAAEDVDEILQLANEEDLARAPAQRINFSEAPPAETPPLRPLPPPPSRGYPHAPPDVGAGPIEDLPSTPGKRASHGARTPWQKGLEMLQTMSPLSVRKGGPQAGDGATASPRAASPRADGGLGGLHPAIRKHPILNWLKKYDPTKDESLVKTSACDGEPADAGEILCSPSRRYRLL